ncbi:MAG: hypothetical protein C0497_00780 [Gemmatimonas sp.]|nr:hypothetical protein [Gemmatimonas sp.]
MHADPAGGFPRKPYPRPSVSFRVIRGKAVQSTARRARVAAHVAPVPASAHLPCAMALQTLLSLRRVAAVVLLGAAGCSDSPSSPPGSNPPIANTVTLNGATVKVAIAATRASRAQGLMGVTQMAADSGMLFVFADDRQRPFWMKNTPIPLSIAFLDASKKVIFLADMTPRDTTVVGLFNAGPMRYAIEVNQGWLAAHGVTLGMYATFSLPAGLVIEPDP